MQEIPIEAIFINAFLMGGVRELEINNKPVQASIFNLTSSLEYLQNVAMLAF